MMSSICSASSPPVFGSFSRKPRIDAAVAFSSTSAAGVRFSGVSFVGPR
jgi:hypothetical protein